MHNNRGKESKRRMGLIRGKVKVVANTLIDQ